MKQDTCQESLLYQKQDGVNNWLESLRQSGLEAEELSIVQSLSNNCFGYFSLQLGVSQKVDSLAPFTIEKKLYLASNAPSIDDTTDNLLYSDPLHLPLANNSCDLVVIHHLHELVDDPHQCIHEAARIVRNKGTLCIIGTRANPWQLFLTHARKNNKWQQRVVSSRRLQDWLQLIEFSEQTTVYDNRWFKLITKHFVWTSPIFQWLTKQLPMSSTYCIKAHKHQRVPVITLEQTTRKMTGFLDNITRPRAHSKGLNQK